MGYCIKINAYYKWECTYFVQGANVETAINKAYEMFKDTVSCNCPDTLEDARKDTSIDIDVIAVIETIIL